MMGWMAPVRHLSAKLLSERQLGALGHEVRLMPAQYVKAYIKIRTMRPMRKRSARRFSTRPRSGARERAMTRDGTVGRSDATEPNLALHRDIDPVRMMRTRFADPIRASSPPGLREQAGHMTASDFCAARYIVSCQAGAIHT
jgi:hypothetical protein